MNKVEYVLGQPNPGEHHCHWPGCPVLCKPAFWGCRRHWYLLPKYLRDLIWRTYRPGQEIDKRPSRDYVRTARRVEEWILVNYPLGIVP